MNSKSVLAGTCVALSLSASAVLASVDFEDWDITGEGIVSLMEWDTALGARTIFEKLDENGNGGFDFEESTRDNIFFYDITADADKDGRIEMAEFILGSFRRLDTNDDNAIDAEEFEAFAAAAADSRLFSEDKDWYPEPSR